MILNVGPTGRADLPISTEQGFQKIDHKWDKICISLNNNSNEFSEKVIYKE